LRETLQANALIAPLTHFAVIGAVLWYGFRGNHRRLENSIAEKLAAIGALTQDKTSTTAIAENGGNAMKRILLPVDASENTLNATRHVLGRCMSESGIELHLLHVCTPFSQHVARFVSRRNLVDYHRHEAEKSMRAARRLLNAHGIPYITHVELGDKARSITATAGRIHACQIVIGTARKNSLTRMIEDSVTNRVLEQTAVPVEVIAGEAVPRFERIGVPASIGAILAALVLALD
jgi:nucleotide-binding universal stress UspA family protein